MRWISGWPSLCAIIPLCHNMKEAWEERRGEEWWLFLLLLCCFSLLFRTAFLFSSDSSYLLSSIRFTPVRPIHNYTGVIIAQTDAHSATRLMWSCQGHLLSGAVTIKCVQKCAVCGFNSLTCSRRFVVKCTLWICHFTFMLSYPQFFLYNHYLPPCPAFSGTHTHTH